MMKMDIITSALTIAPSSGSSPVPFWMAITPPKARNMNAMSKTRKTMAYR